MNKNGNIRKTTGDYEVRKGLTKKPLADIDFVGKLFCLNLVTFYCKNLPKIMARIYIVLMYLLAEITILHLWIHALTFLLKIAVHLRCDHLFYDETADIKGDCDRALKEIQQVVRLFGYLLAT